MVRNVFLAAGLVGVCLAGAFIWLIAAGDEPGQDATTPAAGRRSALPSSSGRDLLDLAEASEPTPDMTPAPADTWTDYGGASAGADKPRGGRKRADAGKSRKGTKGKKQGAQKGKTGNKGDGAKKGGAKKGGAKRGGDAKKGGGGKKGGGKNTSDKKQKRDGGRNKGK